MALAGDSELFKALGRMHGKPAPRKACRSVLPYEMKLEDGSEGRYEFDYEWEGNGPEDALTVTITTIRAIWDGHEVVVPVSAFPQRWLRDREYEIGEEVAADLEAAALSLRDGR